MDSGRRAIATVALLAAVPACSALFGLTPVTALDVDAPPDPCGASSDNLAGCACETVSAAAPCFLGAHEPISRCAQGGQITCGADHQWSACTGATGPTEEACFDGVDNDCDGVLDNGCTCATPDNLCLDSDSGAPFITERLVVNPPVIARGDALDVFAVSQSTLPAPSYQTDSTYCTQQVETCPPLGGACAGWTVVHIAPPTNGPWFDPGAGMHGLDIHVGDDGAACTAPYLRTLGSSVELTN